MLSKGNNKVSTIRNKDTKTEKTQINVSNFFRFCKKAVQFQCLVSYYYTALHKKAEITFIPR